MAYEGLYAFTLPVELLETLQVRVNALVSEPEPPPPSARAVDASSLGCAACAVASFSSLSEQRLHSRTDWHRYNVKLRLSSSDKPPVTEDAFNGLVDALDDSLSGSASSDSDDSSDSSSTHAVTRLLKGAHVTQDDAEQRTAIRSPILWSTADATAPDTQFGLYRHIFPSSDAKGRADPPEGWIEALRRLQVQPEVPRYAKKVAAAMAARSNGVDPNDALAELAPTPPESRTWAFLFIGGGHFAAMIVSLVPKLSRGAGGKLDSSLQVLAHKTYHRYTTRRKQGGGQSANDNAKGNAKSIGAQMRRANEQKLTEDIRDLLTEWKDLMISSELVFMRSSRSNHRIFYDYDDAVLKRGDCRIRSVPFSTRRPTLAELERCFNELTRVKISHLNAEDLAAQDEAEMKKLAPPPPVAPTPVAVPKAPSPPKLTKEEEALRDRWERVVDMTKKGRLDALAAFIERHPDKYYTGALPDWLGDLRTPSLLHVAVQADQPDVVRWLLYEQRADPTFRTTVAVDHYVSDGDEPSTLPTGKTAYDLASSKATRNVFRRCMADHSDWWDWQGAAHVPSPLTAEQEAKDRAREEVKRRAREREEAKATALEADRIAEERAAQEAKDAEKAKRLAALQAAKGGPQRLGGGPPSKVMQAQTSGLTEEQRMRAERERRARAAEARLRG